MPPRRLKRSRARRHRSGISRPILLGGMVAVPVLLLLGVVILVWPLISGLSLFTAPKSSLANTEILIDRSVAMDASYWGGQSKLEFAQETIAEKLLSRPSSKIPAGPSVNTAVPAVATTHPWLHPSPPVISMRLTPHWPRSK